MLYHCWMNDTPIGPLKLVSDQHYIIRLDFYKSDPQDAVKYLTKHYGSAETQQAAVPLLQQAQQQLTEYFLGNRKSFQLPLAVHGTPFQQRCWQALCAIPYGETRTYAQQAALVGSPNAFRAVGQANHRNPIAILIPCHRVVGSDGLCGFGGGLDVKAALLELER